jgi:hypothetical protein
LKLPFEERQYCQTFAIYGRTIAVCYEKVQEGQTWKMEQKKKKTSGISFTLEKLRESADRDKNK